VLEVDFLRSVKETSLILPENLTRVDPTLQDRPGAGRQRCGQLGLPHRTYRDFGRVQECDVTFSPKLAASVLMNVTTS